MDTTADTSQTSTVKRKASGPTPSELLKRKKTGEDAPIGFELELDGMGVAGEGEHYAALLARPPLGDINPATKAIIFQQIELDNYVGEHLRGMPGA